MPKYYNPEGVEPFQGSGFIWHFFPPVTPEAMGFADLPIHIQAFQA